jgi:hypothetical protein
LPDNRIPTQTASGAQTWWEYMGSGEAIWVGKAPGGDMIGLGWDSLGLLKSVSDTAGGVNTAHKFTYAPSGLRIRDERTGTAPRDRRFAYTTTGMLLSVWEGGMGHEGAKKTDIIYANGEAIAEIAVPIAGGAV